MATRGFGRKSESGIEYKVKNTLFGEQKNPRAFAGIFCSKIFQIIHFYFVDFLTPSAISPPASAVKSCGQLIMKSRGPATFTT